MVFNSLPFAAFFLVVYALYRVLPHRGQNALLLAASTVFYGSWDWRFLALLHVTIATDYWVGLKLGATENETHRLRYVRISVAVNLLVLGFFKYFNFFLEGLRGLLAACGLEAAGPWMHIALPVGISFYTFKSLSYTLDVYGRQLAPVRSWMDYATFVSFFPQILSGPIDRASALLPQLARTRTLTRAHLESGCWLFFWGLFQKLVVADNLAGIVAASFDGAGPASPAAAWSGLYAFMVQMLADFSGYTDMARGLACLLGFETAQNFRSPYLATNPVDFWQRWHISLSLWVQDYIYFPLAAALLRRSSSPLMQHLPHVLVMVLIGLWHDATAPYIAFGFYWGVAIVLFGLLRRRQTQRARREKRKLVDAGTLPLAHPRRLLGTLVFFHVIAFAMLLFRSRGMGGAWRYLEMLLSVRGGGVWLFGGFSRDTLNQLLALAVLAWPLALVQVSQERAGDPLAVLRWPLPLRAVFFGVLLVLLVSLARIGGAIFIYVNF